MSGPGGVGSGGPSGPAQSWSGGGMFQKLGAGEPDVEAEAGKKLHV